jgi:hypothetical protein
VRVGSRQLARWLALGLVVCWALPAAAASGAPAHGSRASRSRSSRDVIVSGRGDEAGYHLYAASGATGWSWHEVAALDPGGASNEPWIGYQCATPDGRFAVVVTAPRSASNIPAAREHGAFAYSVDLSSGQVTPLANGVALMYFNPGCGAGHEVALSRYLGGEERRTEVVVFDAATGDIGTHAEYQGEVTSAVPTNGGGVVGAIGNHVVRLDPDRLRVLATTPGEPFDLRASGAGVQLLVARRQRALFARVRDSSLQTTGSAPLTATDLYPGAGGRNVLVTSSHSGRAPGFQLSSTPRQRGSVLGASLGGSVVLSAPAGGHTTAETMAAPARWRPRFAGERLSGPAGGQLPGRIRLGGDRGVFTRSAAAGGPQGGAHASVNTTTPVCSVPRLDLNRQVPQPNTAEVNWAIQQATRGKLKGSVLTRPENFAHMGLVAYQPSSDFAPVALSGGGVVPPSIIDAIFAQESNWLQASFHSLPGVPGDPLIADYYGAHGGISEINYENADCGYGIGQVTTGMTAAAASPYSEHGKWKIAVDYAENIAAAIQILAQSWNTLAAAGVTLNNGESKYLENWYFAIWAYNTGFHAKSGSSPWGLGWTNNPQNSSYPPNRTHFLRETYEDAAHPADWPYQERVVGFMETPLFNYKGQKSYARPVGHPEWQVQIPEYEAFCTVSDNCSPSYENPKGHELDYCELESRQCWWHEHVNYASCSSVCATSVFNVSETATEPANDPNYIPDCQSVLPAGTIIVDNQSSDVNMRGCSPSNWSNQGTFSVEHGENGSGVPIGVIDWHQIGTGFGGHTYFTHNRLVIDTAHKETGTWTPGKIKAGIYAVQVHVPDNGATAEEVTYQVYSGGGGSSSATINQHIGGNHWVPLGDYELKETGAKVVLTNVNSEASGTRDIAYDAVAFTFIANPQSKPQELAEQFEPVLKFDSSEKWRPLNLTAFFEETEGGEPAQYRCIPLDSPDAPAVTGEAAPLEEKPGDYYVLEPAGPGTIEVDVSRCEHVSSIAAATAWRSEEAYIDIGPLGHSDEVEDYRSSNSVCVHNEILDCNGGEVENDPYSASYYTITDSSGHAFIEYWYFYRYNSFSDSFLAGGSHHEGDWESVAVAPSADHSHLEYVSFSQHGGWYSYLRSALECADQEDQTCGTEAKPRGKRVVDFVSNGDHANYSYACSETIGVPPYPECGRGDGGALGERGHDGEHSWGHDFDGEGLLPMPALGAGNWSDWSGHWGATASDTNSPWQDPGQGSPESPGAQSMFQQPWGECGQDIGENECALPSRAGSRPIAKAAALQRLSGECRTWFGGGVAAVVCDRAMLKQTVRERAFDRPGALRLRLRRAGAQRRARTAATRVGEARGIAQAVGPALRSGDRLVVTGNINRSTVVAVRVLQARREASRFLRLRPSHDVRETVAVGSHGRLQISRRGLAAVRAKGG